MSFSSEAIPAVLNRGQQLEVSRGVFHSRLKTLLFSKSFPPWPTPLLRLWCPEIYRSFVWQSQTHCRQMDNGKKYSAFYRFPQSYFYKLYMCSVFPIRAVSALRFVILSHGPRQVQFQCVNAVLSFICVRLSCCNKSYLLTYLLLSSRLPAR